MSAQSGSHGAPHLLAPCTWRDPAPFPGRTSQPPGQKTPEPHDFISDGGSQCGTALIRNTQGVHSNCRLGSMASRAT